MGPVSLVLYDIDGTLLNSGGRGRAAMAAAASDLFGRPDMFDDLSFAGAVDSGIVARALFEAGIPPTPRRMGRMQATYERRLRRDLSATPGTRCPGVPEVVEATRKLAKVGLLTGNWPGGARIKLAAHGLGECFAGCVGAYGSDAVERNQLLPHAIRRARRRWGEVRRVVIVGDTPADVACARAGAALLGPGGPEVLAVAVETGFSTAEQLRAAEPDLQVADLIVGRSALLDLIAIGEPCVEQGPLGG